MEYSIKSISDSGTYNTPLKNGRTWRCDFIIHDGLFVLVSNLLTVNGEEIVPGNEVVTKEIISLFHEQWVRLQGCNTQYDVYLQNTHDNEFEIQLLYRYYAETKDDNAKRLSFDAVFFSSPTINRYYLDSYNISAYRQLPTKNLSHTFKMAKKSFKLSMPYGNGMKEIDFDFAYKVEDTDAHFSFLTKLSYSTEIKVMFCFRCANGGFSLEDIGILYQMVNNYLSFICFEQVDDLCGIDLFQNNEEGYPELHKLYSASKDKSVNKKRPIINFSDIKAAGMKAIMEELFKNGIDISLILPIQSGMVFNVDVLRYCAAIEYEVSFNNNYKKIAEKIRKGIGHNNIKKSLIKLKKSVRNEYKDDFASAIMVFEKFDGRLASKLNFAYGEILALYNEKAQKDSFLYITNESVIKRVKNVRNGLGHGLRDEKNRLWQTRDVDYLQAMAYMLILTRLKVSKSVIKHICVKAFGLLDDLLHRQNKQKK